MKPEHSLPYSQELATGYLSFILILFFPQRLNLSSGPFHSGFPIKIMSPMPATCCGQLILLNLIFFFFFNWLYSPVTDLHLLLFFGSLIYFDIW
jgi:hypothetical protein